MSHKVTFVDLVNSNEIEKWALTNCPSFEYKQITDVSDVSGKYDTIYEFMFNEEKDAMWFRLKWS